MKFWIIQTEKVIEYILNDNAYNPNFSESLRSKGMKGDIMEY